MNFIHFDLGHKQPGEIIEIDLSAAANVRLMNSSHFSAYRRNGYYESYGGLARKPPVRLAVPQSDHWHVAVDMKGLRGATTARIRTLPGLHPIV